MTGSLSEWKRVLDIKDIVDYKNGLIAHTPYLPQLSTGSYKIP
jgi:hypothetical protein